LGGYFVLYALTRQLTEPSVFNNFVAASPSLYYHDNYLIAEIDRSLTSQKDAENINVYLTVGELETASSEFKQLSKILTDTAIRLKTEVYKNTEHMGTAIPTFENGIQLFMGKQNLKVK